MHDFVGVSTSIVLTPSPTTKFSGVIGNENLYVGGEVAFYIASGNFLKYDEGLSILKLGFVSSFTL